jgi:nucleotide-binding universal stress UspA family protein
MNASRPERILVFVDGRGRRASVALEYAAALAQLCEASVKIIDVVREPLTRLARVGGRSYLQRMIDARREQLEASCKCLVEQGIEHTIEVGHGVPFVEVIRTVLADDTGLLIKSVERRGALGIFGSTDLSLLRKCPCPVLLLRGAGARLQRLLAAVDPDPEDVVRDSLNPRIMAHAALLRQLAGGSLDIAHAWHMLGEELLRGGSDGLSQAELRALLRGERQARLAALEKMLAPHGLGIRDPRVHLLKGRPEDVLPEVAARIRADLLIMGTVGRIGLEGVFMGNTAETILSRVDCSVLAVKPAGFVSPVTVRSPN